MKPCLSNYESVNRLRRGEPNCASAWPLSIHLPMLVDGKGDALGIAECARISSICAVAPWSTICMSWLVPLISRMLPDFLTDALLEKCQKRMQRLPISSLSPCSYDTLEIRKRWFGNVSSGSPVSSVEAAQASMLLRGERMRSTIELPLELHAATRAPLIPTNCCMQQQTEHISLRKPIRSDQSCACVLRRRAAC